MTAFVINYEERSRSIRELGFATYVEYRDSVLWKRIRLTVLQRDECYCRICRRPASHVHHRSYSIEVMSGRELET